MLCVGVTGHRILVETEKVAAGIDVAVQEIQAVYPGQCYRVLSSLAEGADRLVADRFLRLHGAQLEVPLPLPECEYIKDFGSPRSVEEFRRLLNKAKRIIPVQEGETREAAYRAAGRFVVENCDLLIAVWDGQPAQGEGGTAEIVELARARGIPLAWVRAGNRDPRTGAPRSLGSEQGAVSFERLPDPPARKSIPG